MILAHGGTAGAVAEGMFLLVPVALFWGLSRWARRRASAEGESSDAPPQGPGTSDNPGGVSPRG